MPIFYINSFLFTFFMISLSFMTLDFFFPTTISFYPGLISILITCCLLTSIFGLLSLYFGYFFEKRKLVQYFTIFCLILLFLFSFIFIINYSSNNYLEFLISKFYRFIDDYPKSLETKWILEKLNFKNLNKDQKLNILEFYFGNRTKYASKYLFFLLIFWLILSSYLLYDLQLHPKDFSFSNSTPSEIQVIHFE